LAAIGGGVTMLTGLEPVPQGLAGRNPFSSYVSPAFCSPFSWAGARPWPQRRCWSLGTGAAGFDRGRSHSHGLAGERGLILRQPSAPSPTEVFFFVIGLIMLAWGSTLPGANGSARSNRGDQRLTPIDPDPADPQSVSQREMMRLVAELYYVRELGSRR